MIHGPETVISACAILFAELFYKGRFSVPWHQRNYDWNISDVQALLQDIDEAIKEDRRCYFLGTILLVNVDEGRWEINDGQQRMVTISLICAALCRRFSQETHDSQREAHALRMLFQLDANGVWSLNDAEHYEPRIDPPISDRMRYRQIIRGNTIGTNSKITSAWRKIENFLGSNNVNGRWEKYFDFIRERLEIACLITPHDIDSNAVYETINCRGKKLQDMDLIRNFIYSHFNEQKEDQRKETVHYNLERIREVFPNAEKASNYMRCYMQCRFGFLRKDKFYQDVRSVIREQRDRTGDHRITPASYVFEVTKEITKGQDLELFRSLTTSSPDPDILKVFQTASNTTHSPRNLTVYLRELTNYTITQPLIFALMLKFFNETNPNKKRNIAKSVNRNLNRLTTFVLRTAFVAPKFEPSHFEEKFSNFAMNLTSSTDIPDDEFIKFLKDCDRSEYGVLDDEKFKAAMKEGTLRGGPKIKNFLLGVNRYQRRDAVSLNDKYCTVEHILPKSPEHLAEWEGFREVDSADWIHRIGNLTLLSAADNKPGAKYNSNFTKKKQIYNESSVAITRELFGYGEWSPIQIDERQNKLVEKAVHVWEFK